MVDEPHGTDPWRAPASRGRAGRESTTGWYRTTMSGVPVAERTSETPVLRIEPLGGWRGLGLRELWEHRELVAFLAWRDVKVRYAQTALGAAWAVLQPVMTMVVFSIFFGRLGGMPSDGLPYSVFSYAALVPWGLFANGLTSAAGSVVAGSNLIQKVYFPRFAIPLAPILSSLLDFGIALGVLAVLMALYGISPTWNIVWLPLLIVLTLITSLGVGLWLAALNVRYRDVRYTIPFLLQIWLFATPIAYPSSIVPEGWRTLYALNPLVGVVDGFRWALLGTASAPSTTVCMSSAAALLVLVTGAYYFRRVEALFADIV
jgi:lipopolysaccharide transport system permease protein